MWIYSCYMTQYWKQQTAQGEGRTEHYEIAISFFKIIQTCFLDILVAKLKWFGTKNVQSFLFQCFWGRRQSHLLIHTPWKINDWKTEKWRFGVWKIKCLFNWVIFRFQPLSSGVVVTLPETNSKFAPENRPKVPIGKDLVFQPSIFRGELLVLSGLIQQFLLWKIGPSRLAATSISSRINWNPEVSHDFRRWILAFWFLILFRFRTTNSQPFQL